MKRVTLLLHVLLLMTASLFSGCGEKIAIPEAQGLFSVSGYREAGVFDEIEDPRQLVENYGSIFLIQGTTLSKRGQSFEENDNVESVTGFGDLTSVCVDRVTNLVFVFDQSNTTLSWYTTGDLELMGSTSLPEVQSVVSMVTQSSGIDLVPDGVTFLYLSDPQAEVIHRFAFTNIGEVVPFGILTRGGGESARFVHQVAGLSVDADNKVLVCDADPQRNWVIRFDSTPDTTDTTPDEDDIDPMRGLAVTFNELDCLPQPLAAYVLGNAPGCNQTSWEGDVSSADGEFHTPRGVAVDGLGRIFVAATGNNRVQIFSEKNLVTGYDFDFLVDDEDPQQPVNISLMSYDGDGGVIFQAAYVYLLMPDEGLIYKFMSNELYNDLNSGQEYNP